MATIVRTDGTTKELIGTRANKALALEQLREAVKGNIECVTLADGGIMILNEEGKLLPEFLPNPKATKLLQYAGGLPGDTVMGDVVLATSDDEGEMY